MKTILSLLAIVALASSAFGQTGNRLNQAVNKVQPPGVAPEPPVAALARGIIDQTGNVIVNGLAGSLSRNITSITAGATPSFAPSESYNTFTLTPAEAETIAAVTTNAVKGRLYTLLITTSGTTSYTITFGSNFTSQGTLVTGTTTAITYTVLFVYNGTSFIEVSRQRDSASTVALTAASPTVLGSAEGIKAYTLTPTATSTINAAVVQRAGEGFSLIVLTSGTSSYTLTFGTGFVSTGTLATGTVDAKTFIVRFISNGTSYYEAGRTTAM